jgi:DNA-binding NarL/FixJ family response regulator
MIKVAIADDHQMFIDGIKSIFADNIEVEITFSANNGEELIYKLLQNPVDIILVDADMPKMDGLEVTQRIINKDKKSKIIVLTMHNEKNYITNFIKSGASGYVLKNTSESELFEAITAVFRGETFYSQKVAQVIMKGLAHRTDDKVQISDREIDVLRLVAAELTTKEIAVKLFISENTVETHRKNLIGKLGVRNAIGLVKYAIKEGLLEDKGL